MRVLPSSCHCDTSRGERGHRQFSPSSIPHSPPEGRISLPLRIVPGVLRYGHWCVTDRGHPGEETGMPAKKLKDFEALVKPTVIRFRT